MKRARPTRSHARALRVGAWAVLGCLGAGCDDAAPGAVDAGPLERDAAELAVCRFNSDCVPGYYCKERRCDLDCRADRDCAPRHTCQSGQCIPPVDPPPPPPPPCAADGACAPPQTVCVAGACVAGCLTTGCGAEETCAAGTGRCAPFDCRRDGCPPTDREPAPVCEAATGRCVVPPDPVEVCGEVCRDDEYCDADLRRCVLRPADCTPQSCAANERCNADTGVCEPLPFDCRRDGCPAPQVCNAQSGTCGDPAPFDCNLGDQCPPDTECVVRTGQCEAPAPRFGELGDPCQGSSDCQSVMCLGTNAGGFCSTPCCSERDCPQGFGCIYSEAGGGRVCLPARLFQGDFSTPSGGACGGGINNCRTGMCLEGQCAGACCTDADCGGGVDICAVLPAGFDGGARSACDFPNIGFGGPAGSLCGDGIECWNRICLLHPDATPENIFGFCSDTCCTHADCQQVFGAGYGCGLTGFFDGANQLTFTINACAALPFGDRPDGEACARDGDCQSAACMEGVCRQPCCHDRQCAPPLRCLPRQTTENVSQRVCAPPDPPPAP